MFISINNTVLWVVPFSADDLDTLTCTSENGCVVITIDMGKISKYIIDYIVSYEEIPNKIVKSYYLCLSIVNSKMTYNFRILFEDAEYVYPAILDSAVEMDILYRDDMIINCLKNIVQKGIDI